MTKDIFNLNNSNLNLYSKFNKKEILKIKEIFKFNIIKITLDIVIIIFNKDYGIKILKLNKSSNKYLICLIKIVQPINIDKPVFFNQLDNDSNINFSTSNLDKIISIINSNYIFSRFISNIGLIFYFNSYNESKKIIQVTRTNPKFLSYNEYKKIINWYNKNKIYILLEEKNNSLNSKNSNNLDKQSILKKNNFFKFNKVFIKIKDNNDYITNKEKKYCICFSI